MEPAKYFTLTGILCVEPIHLETPPVMEIGTTQVQAVNLCMNYQNDPQNWTLVKDTNNTLKLQTLQSFDEWYLLPLWHRTLGYSNVTLVQMQTNLNNTYRGVKNEDSIALKM